MSVLDSAALCFRDTAATSAGGACCLALARSRQQLLQGDTSTDRAWRYAGEHLGRLPLTATVRVLRTWTLSA